MTNLTSALNRHDDIPRCLSFTIEGPWAHFRQIDGNSVRRTYRAPPRTTIAGLIAAVIGCERNSYYDIFQAENSAIAISPQTDLNTQNLPENILTTSKSGIKRIGNNRKGIKLSTPDASKARQRQNFEVLSDVEYRVDCWIDDDDAYTDLKTHLENDTAVYTPSLGLSEFLATIEYHGEYTPQPVATDDPVTVDSTVPGGTSVLIPSREATATIERSPAIMETTDATGPDGPGRRTTAYADINVEQTGGELKTTAPAATVDNRNVVFL